MTCLKDVKYLTKKNVLSLQQIYYVRPGLKIETEKTSPVIIKLEGEDLEKAVDNYLLYDDHLCFTTEQEAIKKMEDAK